MIKVALIGTGKWGKVLHKKLDKICDVVYVCEGRKYDTTPFAHYSDAEWIFVATNNESHYEIVKNCLWFGKNVFCEKPLTLTYEQSEKLYRLAEMRNVKLYVDDIENYRIHNFKLDKINSVERRKSGGGNIKDILYRLAYHDIYTLYKHIKDLDFKYTSSTKSKNYLDFTIESDDMSINFVYDLDSEQTEHKINGYDLISKDDVLTQMLMYVLDDEVDFEYNKEITLFTNKFIDKLNKEMFPKIAVIGGGIFGCTAAWTLAKEGYDVTLYEKNDDIISQASYVNQYRLHRGYHYPRSKETAEQSQWGEHSFLQEYGSAIVNGDIEHYYAIAKEDSLVTSEEYKSFLDEINLDYNEKKLDLIHKNVVDLVVETKELLFNPDELKKVCWDKLNQYSVNVMLNTEYINSSEKYDYKVISTYANLNQLLPEDKQKDYQFELCEKPVIKLPEQYKNKSIVIMDGPFMCIDPLGDSGLHVMGNVVHAIHNTNVGKFPKYDSKFDKLLNKGIIKNPSITNIDKFIESAKVFFKDIEKSEHIGSMYTFRTVLPNKDKDDARPTLVEKTDDKIFTIFSGKIGTCVSAANELLEYI